MVKVDFNEDHSCVSYLRENTMTRRSLERVITQKNKNGWHASTYMTDTGSLNLFSDSPIFIGRHRDIFNVELGCDYEYEPGGVSYDED